jgi:hypothetical protein
MEVKPGFKRKHEFPNESFIQEKIEEYFLSRNFELLDPGYADLKCLDKNSQNIWVVEAKGKTAQMGLDFRTCLGQLLQRMEDPDWVYAIAIPDLPQYRKQCQQVPGWVRRLIKLNWIFVTEDGSVSVFSSEQNLVPESA